MIPVTIPVSSESAVVVVGVDMDDTFRLTCPLAGRVSFSRDGMTVRVGWCEV